MKKEVSEKERLLQQYFQQKDKSPADHTIKNILGLYAITELDQIDNQVDHHLSSQTNPSNEK